MSEEYNKFVIQKHIKGGDIHWDLMLESGVCLWTWRIDKGPGQILQSSAKAIRIFDHPLKFLSYEGTVNNGKGNVHIAEFGTYKINSQSDDVIEINMAGEVLKGKFILERIKDNQWKFGLC